MSEFQNAMNRLIQRFVGQVVAIARRAAVERLRSLPGRSTDSSLDVAMLLPIGPSRRPRSKRTSSMLEVLSAKVLAFIRATPGLRIEQINAQLGVQSGELTLPLRRLMSTGLIYVRGRKRGTTYYPIATADAERNDAIPRKAA